MARSGVDTDHTCAGVALCAPEVAPGQLAEFELVAAFPQVKTSGRTGSDPVARSTGSVAPQRVPCVIDRPTSPPPQARHGLLADIDEFHQEAVATVGFGSDRLDPPMPAVVSGTSTTVSMDPAASAIRGAQRDVLSDCGLDAAVARLVPPVLLSRVRIPSSAPQDRSSSYGLAAASAVSISRSTTADASSCRS